MIKGEFYKDAEGTSAETRDSGCGVDRSQCEGVPQVEESPKSEKG